LVSGLEAELDAIAAGTASSGLREVVCGGRDGFELAKAYGGLATR
jgi:hypothetical protein